MSKASILVVEDEAITSLDIQAELKRLDYQVVGAAFNGEDALRIAQSHQPDLVLMDINLRGKLDGIETALILKERKVAPVVFVTALVDDATIQRSKLCEPYGYIVKPISQDNLRSTIENAVYKHSIEAKLRESEARFRELFETSLDGIITTDATGIIQECNPAFSALLGYSTGELAGMPIADLTPAEFFPLEMPIFKEQVVDQAFSDEFVNEYFHKDGSRIPVNVRVWNKKVSPNQAAGYWWIVRDLTRLRESEQIILHQAEFAQKLVRLTAILNTQLDIDELLETICSEMIQAVGVDEVLITFADPSKEGFRVIHNSGPIDFKEIQPAPFDLHRQFSANGRSHLIFDDIQEELAESPNHKFFVDYDIRSAIFINLTRDARFIRTLDLITLGRRRRLSEDELNFLLTFANQAAIAIDRALLYQMASNRSNDLEAIERLSIALRSAEYPQEMLPILLNEVVNLVQADAGIIYLLGPAGNPIDKFEITHVPLDKKEWFSPDGLLWARALSNEAVVHIPLEPLPLVNNSASSTSLQTIRSVILLSLRSNQTLSAIMVLGFTRPFKSDSSLQHLLSSLTEIGGNALHRSGLMERLERNITDRSSELNTLYDMSVYINSPIRFDEKLEGALDKTIASVGANSGILYRYDRAKNSLTFMSQRNVPLQLLTKLQELEMVEELTNWLETSSIPWLAHKGENQMLPLWIERAQIYHTIINLPLRYQDNLLGLITIFWEERTDLSPEKIALLIALTERIGSAVHNEILRQKSEHSALLEERQRLARELHDSVTQSLYSQMLLAEAASDMVTQNEYARLEKCLTDLRENSLQALKEMRLLLFELRPPLVGQRDFVIALQNRLDAVERRAGVLTFLDVQGPLLLPMKVQNELYFIALEALNNSLKHSGATTVRVTIHSKDRELDLIIADDGKGFCVDQYQSAGMGLTTMQERVKQLGGNLSVVSKPGEGANVIVKLKLNEE